MTALAVDEYQRGDVGKVAVALRVVEPVADRELVRDLEADVAGGRLDLAPLWLASQSWIAARLCSSTIVTRQW